MTRLQDRWGAALVAAALVAIPAAPARAAAAAGPWRAPAGAAVVATAAPPAAEGSAPAAVLGLDADDPEQGAALTKALRRAFAARGLSGGKDANLSELRLALGCKNYAPECLARGGPRLDARRLIYGTLRRAEGKGWRLEATLLEVDGGATTTASVPLAAADLEAGRLDATADAIADRLAPDAAVSATPGSGSGQLAPPPPPEPVEAVEPVEGEAEPQRADENDGGREGKLRWGFQRPQPRWKWAAFGASAGVTVVSAAATIGMSVWLTSRNGGFRRELVEAAEASLTDDNPLNDVDPNLPQGINLCDFARSRPVAEDGTPLGQPGQVRNSNIVEVCNRGDSVRTVQLGTAVVSAVGLAATGVFTVLLFVHREPTGSTARAWRRHGLHVGADPVRGQGLSLRVGGRF